MLIHPFVPSARATSPCDPTKSAQTVPLPNVSKTVDRGYLCRILLKKPSFSGRDFFTKLGPQIRLPPVPNFCVNRKKSYQRFCHRDRRVLSWVASALTLFDAGATRFFCFLISSKTGSQLLISGTRFL
jgi:hypothetical protein